MLPKLHCDCLDTGCFLCSAQNFMDPWNKVVSVKERRMHICVNSTHLCVCNIYKFLRKTVSNIFINVLLTTKDKKLKFKHDQMKCLPLKIEFNKKNIYQLTSEINLGRFQH